MHVFVNGLATPGSPAVLPPREVDFPRPSGLLGCTSPLPGEERVPDLVDRRVRCHDVAECLDWYLGDDGEGGRLGEFGELGSDERRADSSLRSFQATFVSTSAQAHLSGTTTTKKSNKDSTKQRRNSSRSKVRTVSPYPGSPFGYTHVSILEALWRI